MIPASLLFSDCLRYGHTWEKLEDDDLVGARYGHNSRCSHCGTLGVVNWKPDPVLEQEC